MNIDDLKREIEQRAGIPVDLLTGQTSREVLNRANKLLEYKERAQQIEPKETREVFGAWFTNLYGTKKPDPAREAIAALEDAERNEAGIYPATKDGGDPYINGKEAPDPRPNHEQFAEWLKNKLTLDLSGKAL